MPTYRNNWQLCKSHKDCRKCNKCVNDWDCINWGPNEDQFSCCKGICKKNNECIASNTGGKCKIKDKMLI